MGISTTVAAVLLVLAIAAETIWIERDTWHKWLAVRAVEDDHR